MSSLKGTKIAENLMKSFARESQARTRDTYYASIAKKEGYVQIYLLKHIRQVINESFFIT